MPRDVMVRRDATAEIYTPTREVAICGEGVTPGDVWCCDVNGGCDEVPFGDCQPPNGTPISGPEGCWQCACCADVGGIDGLVMSVGLSQHPPGEPVLGNDPPCSQCSGWRSPDPNGSHVLMPESNGYYKHARDPVSGYETVWGVTIECQLLIVPPNTRRRTLIVRAGIGVWIGLDGSGCDEPGQGQLQWSISGEARVTLPGSSSFCAGVSVPVTFVDAHPGLTEDNCGVGEGWLAWRQLYGGCTVHL